MKRMLRIGAVLLAMLLGSGLADMSLFGTAALAKPGKGNGKDWGWSHSTKSKGRDRDDWRRLKDWPRSDDRPVRRRVRRGWDKKAKHHAYGHRRKRVWRKRYHRNRSWHSWRNHTSRR